MNDKNQQYKIGRSIPKINSGVDIVFILVFTFNDAHFSFTVKQTSSALYKYGKLYLMIMIVKHQCSMVCGLREFTTWTLYSESVKSKIAVFIFMPNLQCLRCGDRAIRFVLYTLEGKLQDPISKLINKSF